MAEARKSAFKLRTDEARMFQLTSTFSGSGARMNVLFIFIWFVMPAIFLSTSPHDAGNTLTESYQSYQQVVPNAGNPAAIARSQQLNMQAPTAPLGGTLGGSLGSQPAAPAAVEPPVAQVDLGATTDKSLSAEPAGGRGTLSASGDVSVAAVGDAPASAVGGAKIAAMGNPADTLPEPHKREQVLYSVYANTSKKIMVCLSARSTLYPFIKALTEIGGLDSALNMAAKEREMLFADPDYKRVAFVRNPSTRIYSVYKSKFVVKDSSSDDYELFMQKLMGKEWVATNKIASLPKPTFMEFLEQVQQNGYDGDEVWDSIQVICGMDKVKYDYILRTESYIEDTTKILKALGLPRIPSAVHNDSEFTNEIIGIGNVVKSEERQLLAKMYKEDYEKFGYTQLGTDFTRAPRSEHPTIEF